MNDPPMRLSTRLLVNAATTYARMGVTFLLGIFMLWYLIDRIGLIGLGLISLVTGTMGIGAIDAAIRQSVVREMAASIGSGESSRVQRTLVSGLAYCVLAGVVLLLGYLAMAAAAWLGVFQVPDDLVGVFMLLLFVEGAIFGVRMAIAPYTQAIFAARRVGIDNLLVVFDRLVSVIAAVLAFSVFWPGAALPVMLGGYAAVRGVVAAVEMIVEVLIARRLVPDLRFRRTAFDGGEFRAIAGTVWHSGQMTVLALASPKIVLVLVNLFYGLMFNGLWHIVTTVRGHASMIADGVLRGADPIAAHLHEAGQRGAIVNLMVHGVRYQLLAVLPFAACYAILLVPILELWVGDRLADDPSVTTGVLSARRAIEMVAIMGAIGLLAEVLRAGTRGVERMLFGAGEIRAYAWFARYAAIINVAGAALLMWIFDTVLVAPVPLVVANGAYFGLVIPIAASRRIGFPVRRMLRRSLPRPLIVTVLLAAPVAWLSSRIQSLSLPGLLLILAGVGLTWTVLVFTIGLDGAERRRIRELAVAVRCFDMMRLVRSRR